jgi:hypothetical protein
MQMTPELLGHAQAKLKRAERALVSHPSDKWLKASVDFLQDEVETIRRILLKEDARLLAFSERNVAGYERPGCNTGPSAYADLEARANSCAAKDWPL